MPSRRHWNQCWKGKSHASWYIPQNSCRVERGIWLIIGRSCAPRSVIRPVVAFHSRMNCVRVSLVWCARPGRILRAVRPRVSASHAPLASLSENSQARAGCNGVVLYWSDRIDIGYCTRIGGVLGTHVRTVGRANVLCERNGDKQYSTSCYQCALESNYSGS